MLSNPHFNRMVQRTRGRMGMTLIAMQNANTFFSEPLKEHSTVFFIGDQSPNPKRAYWTKFLNQDTGFFTGGERYAKAHNCAVVYIEMVQIERGKYTIELYEICDDANALGDNEITEQFSKHLERTIRKQPSDWLWSHNRWKHKRP
jgi:KDO2-lipid IV(A) lauroyltransferase